MNDSRAAILKKLKIKSDPLKSPAECIKPAFVVNSENQTLLLKQKLEAVHASVDIVSSIEEKNLSIYNFLQSHHSPPEIGVAPAIDAANWPQGRGLYFYPYEDFAACETVLTSAACGIAETGTVVLPSSSKCPTLANFLPDNCIVLLEESNIVPYLEDALLKIQKSDAGMPRALNLISGPSKTADIEQTLVYGAHGPIQLHVIIQQTVKVQ